MKWFSLWTDVLLYILLFMLFAFVYKVLKSPVLRQQMRSVIMKPLNCMAIFILCIYVAIGTLDSVHFEITDSAIQKEYPNSIISLLDIILKPALTHSEKTYSAPFATHAYTKESIIDEQGEIVREFPRLQYGGIHLENPDLKMQDIKNRVQTIFLQSLILGITVFVGLSVYFSRKQKISFEAFVISLSKGTQEFPFKTFYFLLFLTIFIILLVQELMPLYHILGTSKVGEDVFYQSMKSIRTGLIIGTLTTLIMLPFATFLGVMAGYFLGWIDDVIQYSYTTLSSIPGVLLIAAAVLTLQVVMARHEAWFQTMSERSDARLLALCVILGITSWTGLCRLLRGEALKLREIEYVQAARSLGLKHFSIISKHIIPNVMHIILIAVALDFSGLVLAEAVLSYVGVGVDPSTYSWGTMINGARLEMARMPMVWWSLCSAFIFMFILVLSANIFSDALRDAFDPRTQFTGGK